MRRMGLASVIWALLLAPSAPAAAGLEVDYVAPALCPDEASFWGAVRERSLNVRSSTSGLGVRVTITASAATFAGEISRSGGPVRRLAAQSCEDLGRALALIVAMTLDAEPAATEGPTPPPPKPVTRKPRPAAPQEVDATLSIGADAAFAFGMVPGNGLSLPIFVELRFKNGVRARGIYHRASGEATGLPSGAASFTLNSGRLEVCPLSLPLGPVEAMPCGSFEAGTVHASPSAVSSADPSDQLWLAAGALLRLRLMVQNPLFLEGNAGFSVPFQRAHYTFSPGVEVFETASVAASFGLGAGVAFW
jgi:hypothetical protein